MKNIILFVAILSTFTSFSQTTLSGNGGQSAENGFSKLVYLGYQSGSYVVQITNKQSCTAGQKINWLSKDSTFNVAANTTITINLPGAFVGSTKITDKPLDRCVPGGGDMGLLEITTPISLPIKFKSIHTTKVSSTELRVDFDVAEVSGVNTYNVQISDDGIHYRTVAVVFPDDTQPNRVYSVVIKVK